MKLIFLLAALLMPVQAQAQRRAVMEALATSNTSIYVSSGTNVYANFGGSVTITGALGLGGALNVNGITLSRTRPLTATVGSHAGNDGYISNSGGLATGGSNGTVQGQRVTASGDLLNIRRVQAGETKISNVPDFLNSGSISLINGGLNWTWARIEDINMDGRPDMVYASDVRIINVNIGSGNGFVTPTVSYALSAYGTSSGGGFDVDDVDGDGLPDIVEANAVDGRAVVWLNLGISTATTFVQAFSGPSTYTIGTANTGAYAMKLGDLNGDGRPDIAVNRASSDFLVVLMNNGNGTFAAPSTYATGDNPQSLVIADLNNDGRNDIVVANFDDNNISVFMNAGSGVFSARVNYALGSVLGTDYGGNPSALAVGDFNLDGKLDILVSNRGTIPSTNSTLTRLLGDGAGGFASPINYYACQFASDVKVGDFNGDGIVDALSECDFSQHAISYYVGNGTGTFNTIATRDMTGGDRMSKMEIGDINMDGKLDVVFGADGSGARQMLATVNPMIYAQASTSRVGISTGSPQSTLDINGSFQWGASATASTGASSGSLSLATNADMALTGPTAYATFPASVTASAFFGNGSALTGVTESNTYASSKTFSGAGGVLVSGAISPTAYSLTISSTNGSTSFGVTGGGHVVSSGTTPSIVCNAGTPVMAADSNDMSGQFVAGTGAANCTLTFVNAFAKKPRCWCNNESTIVVTRAVSTTTTLKCDVAISFSGETVTYGCMGAP